MRLLLALSAPLAALALLAGCSAVPEATLPPAASSAVKAAAVAPVRPTEIEVPSIGAKSSLIATGMDAQQHVLAPPVDQPMQASYFTGAPAPGEVGPALVLGHVNGGGRQGIFYRLKDVKKGDRILVTRSDGSVVTFEVHGIQQVPKMMFPWTQVLAPTPDAEIRLVTCTGTLDTSIHSYQDNLIVFGHKV